MSMTEQFSVNRSTSAATHAAPGKMVPHCLNGRLVVMTVERWRWAAADVVVEDVPASGIRGQIPELVDDEE
jgi:hypothetical protein